MHTTTIAYPTLADRLSFAHCFASNKAVVLFYGKAYDPLFGSLLGHRNGS